MFRCVGPGGKIVRIVTNARRTVVVTVFWEETEMKWTFDESVDAAYLLMVDRPVTRTIPVADNVNLDFDDEGVLLGVEILDATRSGLTRDIVGQSA